MTEKRPDDGVYIDLRGTIVGDERPTEYASKTDGDGTIERGDPTDHVTGDATSSTHYHDRESPVRSREPPTTRSVREGTRSPSTKGDPSVERTEMGGVDPELRPVAEERQIERVLDSLLAALRDERFDAPIAEIRQELASDPSGSFDIRLNHLQREVSALRAYSRATKKFIEDNDSVEQKLDSLRSDIAEVTARVDEIEADRSSTADRR